MTAFVTAEPAKDSDQPDTGVMPVAEIRKPLPPATQVIPAALDAQRNGPATVAVP
jgi:hypothetical protein